MLPPLRTTELLPAVGVNVPPPQPEEDAFGGVLTTRPAGKASVSPTPARGTAPVAVLAILMVKGYLPADSTPNALLTVTGVAKATVSVAEAALVFAAFGAEVNAPTGRVFVYVPKVLLVTLTLIVQIPPFATMVPPLRATELLPAVAVSVAPPQPESDALGVGAITRPGGKVSVSATLARDTVAVLVILIAKVAVPPGTIELTELPLNVLVKVTGGTADADTVSIAEAALVFVVPEAEVTAPMGSVFVYVATVLLVTLTVIIQVLFAVMEPPLKATEPLPAVAVSVPLQPDSEAFGVGAITILVGSVSVNATLESAAAPPSVLAILICKVEVAPGVIKLGVNVLLKPREETVNVAEAALLLVTPLDEISTPAGKILVYIPGELLVTLIVMMQVLPPVTVALFN